ncbi:transposase [Chryseobacterium pennae]|uniref:Transposase n=1 Tax=Chryseobacterium pennae TaxID=2258962 RepID=A0A3D9C0X9_9FLAO|nr:transposase [Chryseobacterium pennae]REC59515.1 transposase [Chryseobacterium pennae]
MNYKEINIGLLIKHLVIERQLSMSRICDFINCRPEDIEEVYRSKSFDTDKLLRWSKLLEYDFFRLYTQHLILYSSMSKFPKGKVAELPQFRKNIYTKEIIDFILGKINHGEMTKIEVMFRYNIPKTTLYKWVEKYNIKNIEGDKS